MIFSKARTLSRVATFVVCGFVIGISLSHIPETRASRNGRFTREKRDSIFFVSDWHAQAGGTAAAIDKRCLLTAKHVADWTNVVMKGELPFIDVDFSTERNFNIDNPVQYVQERNKGIVEPYVPAVRDLAVMMTTNYKAETGKPRIEEWAPLILQNVIDEPLAPSARWTRYLKHVHIGYGILADTVTGKLFDSNKRAWYSWLYGLYKPRPDINSHVFQAYGDPKELTIACPGDSGAPDLMGEKLGSVDAVLSASRGGGAGRDPTKKFEECFVVTEEAWTALNSPDTLAGVEAEWEGVKEAMTTNAGKKALSNFTWVRYLMQTVCEVTLKVSQEGRGTVSGYVSGSSTPPLDIASLNDNYDCGPDSDPMDCIEYIHSDETAYLTADPDSGWKFSHWEDRVDSCSCDQSTSANCTVPYEDVGYYDANTSWDQSTCVAIFIPEQCDNSSVDQDECDDEGTESASCDADCSEVECGDAVTNEAADEECDNGKQCDDGTLCADDPDCTSIGDELCLPRDENGCSAECTLEEFCGDEVVTESEQCDEGMRCEDNTPCWSDADCDDESSCIVRETQTCSATCQNLCGNEDVDTGETCDNGVQCSDLSACDSDEDCEGIGDELCRARSGDGCSAGCMLECGNYTVEGTEQCDDGPHCSDGSTCAGDEDCDGIGDEVCILRDGDGCSASCEIECGNGVTDDSETCDDGKHCSGGAACDTNEDCDGIGDELCMTRDEDGCSSECLEEDESCGDGNKDSGEDCDDAEDSMDCDSDCTFPECGDDHLNETTEQCDDGDTESGDGCDEFCAVEGDCGNGEINGEEECDDENDVANDGCFLCREEYCGDWTTQSTEECDDGNETNGDGCNDECALEVPPDCGDEELDADEECDDGDLSAGDGCDEYCRIEVCGNSTVDDGEECDTGADDQSNCDSDCSYPQCGDEYVNAHANEECDDGNATNNDGCSSSCELECGNGSPNSGEQCDDGNSSNSDSCLNACNVAMCGDGYKRTGVEACDDDNTSSGDGCSSTCTIEECGNNVTDYGESCDDGNSSNNDTCTNFCLMNICGDGYIRTGTEQCDDDNTSPGDGCNSTCQIEICGNGVMDYGEQCDDGNQNNNDFCDNSCHWHF